MIMVTSQLTSNTRQSIRRCRDGRSELLLRQLQSVGSRLSSFCHSLLN